MSGNSKKLFSGAIGGFKKSEVVEYIEELNRKAGLAKEQSDFEISRLEDEVNNLEQKKEQLEERIAALEDIERELAHSRELLASKETEISDHLKTVEDLTSKLSESEAEKALFVDDVSNQRTVIASLQKQNEVIGLRLAELEKDYDTYKRKAMLYDEDIKNAGGVLERAKTESARLVASANAEAAQLLENANNEARESAERIVAESEKIVADNSRKVQYLHKRRDELLSAFEKVRDAAGGFYESVVGTLSKDNNEM